MRWFLDLPRELQVLILSYVDIPSVCRLYVALAFNGGQVIADYLDDKTVEVTPAVVVSGDTHYIDFALLHQLPPCHVKAHIPSSLYQLVPPWFKRWQFKLIHVVLEANSPTIPFKLEDWQMALNTLEVTNCERPFHYQCTSETKVVFRNCDAFSVNGDSVTSFEVYNDEVDPEDIGQVPLLTEKLILPIGTAYDASELPNIKYIDGGSIYNPPWSQLQTYIGTSVPQSRYLDELVEFNCVMNDPSFTFKGRNCSNLKTVSLRQTIGIHTSTSDISELFTEAQMAQLTSLKVPTYLALNVDPLLNLRVLHMRTDKTITPQFPLPPTLVKLQVYSKALVENIPPQLESFKFFGDGDECNVTINSANLKRFAAYFAGDVSLDCPRLTRLTMSSIESISRLKTPNLVTLSFNASIAFPFDNFNFPFLSHLVLSDNSKELILPQRLQLVELSFMRLQSLTLNAETVYFMGCQVTNDPVITSRSVSMRSCFFPTTRHFDCLQLECLFVGSIPRMLESVTIWWHPTDSQGLPTKPILPDIFIGCHKLQSIVIQEALIYTRDGNRLIIPASVKQLLLKLLRTKSVWLQFDDENTLEHFELSSKSGEEAVWSMDQLGLTTKPKSFIVPQSELS